MPEAAAAAAAAARGTGWSYLYKSSCKQKKKKAKGSQVPVLLCAAKTGSWHKRQVGEQMHNRGRSVSDALLIDTTALGVGFYCGTTAHDWAGR